MRRISRNLTVAWALIATPIAHAWGPQGHQTVGTIASGLLQGTNARIHLVQILGNSEPLKTAALWADCAKGVKERAEPAYSGEGRYPECHPFETPAGEAAMVEYVVRNLIACQPTAGQESCHRQYHFADVALQRDHYAGGEVGTSDHDVVNAIRACILVLQGQTAPAPLAIMTKKEAVRLLAHLVGDIHQPLHVGAVYLNQTGQRVDPDGGPFDADTATRGGNQLQHGSKNLHGEWDDIPADLHQAAFKAEGKQLAMAVAATPGEVTSWPEAWATDTLIASHEAFQGLTFGAEKNLGPKTHSWPVTEPANYAQRRADLQKKQLVKAGARLAQLFEAIWP